MTSARPEPVSDLETGLDHHRRGELLEAEAAYRRILAAAPDHPDAKHLLGVVFHQLGRHREAGAMIAEAIERHPVEAIYHCNLGEAHRALGAIDQAIACQRQALALDPGLVQAHNNLGLALQHKGRLAEARAAFEAALALAPDFVDALINLGNALAAEGRVVEATERFERALEVAPQAATAHYNLANALRAQGLDGAAIEHYRNALAIDPGYVEAHNNLGLALHAVGESESAARAFEAAIALDSEHAEAHNNLGLALEARGELAAAGACFERAGALAPALAPAHNNLGRIRQAEGNREAALACFRRAIALDPDYAEAHNNLGHLLKESGRLEDSIASFLRALDNDADDADSTAQLVYQLQHACDWTRLDELGARVDAQTDALLAAGRRPGETPFGSLRRHADPARHLAVTRAWAQGIERRMAASGVRFDHGGRREDKARLRIGYLSADFRDHPVAHQIAPLFEAHDRARIEVHAYVYGPQDPNPLRARIATGCDRFTDLESLSDVDAARRIHADGIDILVDLTGYTKGNRIQIAALRPAPVQVSYLGFLGTSGGSFFDYLLTDRVCTPEEEAPHFTEHLVHLPPSCLVFSDQACPENRYRRLDFGLPDDAIVFTSLNASYKLEPVMFELWMALLRAVPDGVLWLYRAGDQVMRNLEREAKARGIEPRRLIFADRVPYRDNLCRLQLADLGLDTRLYNGGLTTANALLAGVPVVTLRGGDFVSRMGASMLTALDLPELIADSLDDYRERALALARDTEHRAALRARLLERVATRPLFDTLRFARHLEAAYRAMWEVFAAGEAPRPLRIPHA